MQVVEAFGRTGLQVAAVAAPPSSFTDAVATPTLSVAVNDTVVDVLVDEDPSAGAVIVAAGGVVSLTVKLRTGVVVEPPALSVAVAVTVWGPAARPLKVTVQVVEALGRTGLQVAAVATPASSLALAEATVPLSVAVKDTVTGSLTAAFWAWLSLRG